MRPPELSTRASFIHRRCFSLYTAFRGFPGTTQHLLKDRCWLTELLPVLAAQGETLLIDLLPVWAWTSEKQEWPFLWPSLPFLVLTLQNSHKSNVCSAQWLNQVQFFVTPWTVAHQASLSVGILQARILEWGCHPLLQGIFPTQGSNPGLPHCRWILYCLSHQESPRIPEWGAYPISRGSSQHRNQTGASCICRQILYQLSYQGSLDYCQIYLLIQNSTL